MLPQNKKQRGVIRAYVAKATGLSVAQVARLVAQYRQTGEVEVRAYRRDQFRRRYTTADVSLLAAVDRAHESLSGPVKVLMLKREEGGSAMSGRRLERSSTRTVFVYRPSAQSQLA